VLVGVFGGSFNPPHLGHLAIARAVRAALELDVVLLVPAASPPHKVGHDDMETPEHRLAMTLLAAGDDPHDGIEVSDLELRREGRSYTIETMTILREQRPGDELLFIVGGDSVGELPTWKEAPRLLSEVRFVVVARPGYDLADGLAVVARELGPEVARGLRERVVDMEPYPVSSTNLRREIREGGDGWRAWVVPAVADYIEQHGLYGRRRTA
jgi:nicotinate-nucleotide adenylyltransferase